MKNLLIFLVLLIIVASSKEKEQLVIFTNYDESIEIKEQQSNPIKK